MFLHVERHMRTVRAPFCVHTRSCGGGWLAGLGAYGVPVGTEKAELFLEILIKAAQAVIAATTHFVTIENQITSPLGNDRAALDLEGLMPYEALWDDVFYGLIPGRTSAKDASHGSDSLSDNGESSRMMRSVLPN